MSVDRRLHPRIAIRLAGELRPADGSEWFPVELQDLSCGGTRVDGERALELETEVRLRFDLPGSTPPGDRVEVTCLVVRVTPIRRTHPGRPFAYGLQFLNLGSAASERIRRLVWSRLATPP